MSPADFKHMIEGVGKSTIESVEITDEEVKVTQVYTTDQIKHIFECAGYLVTDVYFKDGEVNVVCDSPSGLINLKVSK